MAIKIKKGDNVLVLAGKEKGKTGKVLVVNPNKNRVIVAGLNIVARATKPKKAGEQGGIKKKENPIHISNLQVVCDACGKATRVAYNTEGEKKFRMCKKCGATLDKAVKREVKKAAPKKDASKPAAKKTTTAAKKADESKTDAKKPAAKKPASSTSGVTKKAPAKVANKNTSVRKTGSK